jgi:hypothetical protein
MSEETVEYRGYTIEIWNDDHAENPREWCNLGTLALKNSGWAEESVDDQESFFGLLLDEEDYRPWSREYQDYDRYDIDHEKAWRKIEEKYIVLPVYKYEHSGVCYNTSGFSCPWDSGKAGYIYASKEDVRRDYSVKRISPRVYALVVGVLQSEVKVFSQAVNGEVYGYTTYDPDGETLDSCGGYYGDDRDGYMMEQARGSIDFAIERIRLQRVATIKNFIRNRVPLHIRQEALTA